MGCNWLGRTPGISHLTWQAHADMSTYKSLGTVCTNEEYLFIFWGFGLFFFHMIITGTDVVTKGEELSF